MVAVLISSTSWSKSHNPADRNGLDSLLDQTLSEQNEVIHSYEKTEVAKKYQQKEFLPSSTPEALGILDEETVTVSSPSYESISSEDRVMANKARLEMRKKLLEEQEEALFDRIAAEKP
jgi:hypothetical protein